MAKTEFDEFVAHDVKKQKGISHPVKASTLERFFVKKVSFESLHPNANDEFTFSEIGPSYKIIAEYEENFRHCIRRNQPVEMEPLTVEKLSPKGYLILNGHHRWAAAKKVGLKKLPVKIVNLAQESDIKKILEKSKHDKRVTLDLDEVILRPKDSPYLEKGLNFPFNLRYKQRIRLGIPALFYFLSKNAYDIWIYSANFYSIDDIKRFFFHYSVNVDGIITGAAKKKESDENSAKIEKMLANKYRETIHIDNELLLLTHKNSEEFKEFPLNSDAAEWSKSIIDIIEGLENARISKKES